MRTNGDYPEPQDEIETQLAYWLENTSAEDTQIISVLIEQYGQLIYRFACFLLEDIFRSENELASKAFELTIRVFLEAARNPITFRGAPGIASWLLRLLYKQYLSVWWRLVSLRKLKMNLPRQTLSGESLPVSLDERINELIHDLPKKDRLALIMHIGMGLSNAEIAYVISQNPQRVDNMLSEAISTVQLGIRNQQIAEDEFAEMMPRVIDDRWTVPTVDNLQKEFVQSFERNSSSGALVFTKIRKRLSEIGFVVLITFVVAVITWYLSQDDNFRGKPLFPAIPEATPTARTIGDVPVIVAPDASAEVVEFSYHLAPQLSGDGRWLVFNRADQTDSSSVWLFDSSNGVSVQVDRPYSSDSLGSSYAPQISDNGRWVVFFSDNPRLTRGEMASCRWRDQEIDCMDVFLYDRDSDSLQRISQVSEDEPADGHSVFPAISPDGRWIAFWSSATNLVEGDIEMCDSGYKAHNCWDVYLYDAEERTFTRFPVGRATDMIDTIRIYPLSLSDSGSRLALTIHEKDLIATELGLKNSHEVVVFDRLNDSWETVAVNTDLSKGTGPSYLPKLSQDGHYIAFVSLADRLVPADTNGVADVFVKDLITGQIDLISKSNHGDPGNDHSGVLPEDTIMWGEQLGLSADGRYVTFLSKATNLITPGAKGCVASQFSFCSDVYVHDRLTGETTALITQPRGDGYYIFPGLSGDGRLLYYVQFHLNCNQAPYCADILFYEQESMRTTSPLHGGLVLDGDQAQPWVTTMFFDTPNAGGVHDLAFSPSGHQLIAGLRNGSIWVWEMPEGAQPQILKTHTRLVDRISFDPSGEVFATGSHDGSVILWSAADGSMLRRIAGGEGAVFDMTFFSNGRYLAVAAQRAAWIWDVRDLVFGILDYIEYPGEQVRTVAISPDEKLLVHGLSDGSLWLRSMPDMEVLERVAAHGEMINTLVFSPDGRYLASGGGDTRVILWELLGDRAENWQLEPVLIYETADWVNDLAFSPDSRWLGVAAYRGNIQLWSLDRTGGDDVTLNADGFQPLSIAFSPDGHWLAAGSSWGGVRLWEMPSP